MKHDIGSIWIDASKRPNEFYMLEEKRWKFIGYGSKNKTKMPWPKRFIKKDHKKDIYLNM